MNNTLKQLQEEEQIFNEENIIPLETQLGFKTNVYNILNNSSLGKMGTIETSYIKILKNLMNNGKIENIKIIFELYDVKDKESFGKLIKNKKWHEIKDLIQFGKTENIKIIFKLLNVLNFEDFEKLLNDKEAENIKLFFIYGYSENIKIILELYKSESFENFGKNKNFEEISNLIIFCDPKNLKKIFELYKIENKNDFEKLLNNKNWEEIKNLIENGNPKNIEKIFELYNIQNIKNFEKLFNCEKWNEIKILIEYGTPKAIDKIIYCFTNGFTYNNLSMNDESIKKLLFTVQSFGSEIFEELLRLMKAEPNKDLYEIMRENVGNKFLKFTNKLVQYNKKDIKNNGTKISKSQETKNSDEQKKIIDALNLSSDKLELSIYIRYSNTVDYPEIAEYIILFLEKYINERFSKYISSIRIIPRKKGKYPRTDLFAGNKNNILKKYDVSGNDFITALKKYSIPFHLSGSNYKDSENLPHIISGGMTNNKGKNVIQLGFELEELFDNNNTEKKSLDNILNGLVKVMQTLDKKLDKILDSN